MKRCVVCFACCVFYTDRPSVPQLLHVGAASGKEHTIQPTLAASAKYVDAISTDGANGKSDSMHHEPNEEEHLRQSGLAQRPLAHVGMAQSHQYMEASAHDDNSEQGVFAAHSQTEGSPGVGSGGEGGESDDAGDSSSEEGGEDEDIIWDGGAYGHEGHGVHGAAPDYVDVGAHAQRHGRMQEQESGSGDDVDEELGSDQMDEDEEHDRSTGEGHIGTQSLGSLLQEDDQHVNNCSDIMIDHGENCKKNPLGTFFSFRDSPRQMEGAVNGTVAGVL